MPKSRHKFLVDMFRDNPAILPHLLHDSLNITLPAYTEIREVNADMAQFPPEFRADLVLAFFFQGQAVFAIVLEVQIDREDEKRYSWPAYVAVERSRRKCPCALVVVAVKEAVAAWAGQTIVDGNQGGISLRPVVLGPEQIPLLTVEQAEEEPELAMVSVLAHCDSPRLVQAAEAALEAARKLPADRHKMYNELIFAIFREALRKGLLEKQIMEQLMERYRDEFKGFYEEGMADGQAKSILAVLKGRGLAVSSEVRERVRKCQDPEQLDRWLLRAITVSSADELFQG